MLFIPAQQFRWASPPLPALRGLGNGSRPPDRRGSLNTNHIRQTQFAEPFSKPIIVAVGGIGQHRRRGNFLFYGFAPGRSSAWWQRRSLLEFLPPCAVFDLSSKSLASTDARRSADGPARSPPINSPLPGNFLACPPVPRIDAPPPPNEFLSLRSRYHLQSRPPRIRFVSLPARQTGALFRVRLGHSTVHSL